MLNGRNLFKAELKGIYRLFMALFKLKALKPINDAALKPIEYVRRLYAGIRGGKCIARYCALYEVTGRSAEKVCLNLI